MQIATYGDADEIMIENARFPDPASDRSMAGLVRGPCRLLLLKALPEIRGGTVCTCRLVAGELLLPEPLDVHIHDAVVEKFSCCLEPRV